MPIINTNKPAPAISNTPKTSFAELWSTITTTWATETRTWLDTSSLLDNTEKPIVYGIATEDLFSFLTTELNEILVVEPASFIINTPKP